MWIHLEFYTCIVSDGDGLVLNFTISFYKCGTEQYVSMMCVCLLQKCL